MNNHERPFVMYRKGPLNFTIVPRGWKGWTQFGAWLALLPLICFGFARYAEEHPTGSEYATGVFLFVLAVGVWLIGGLWWMAEKSEVVDVVEVLRSKQKQERKRRKQQP